MKIYKDFVIYNGSSVHEETQWDGHRNEGTGRYDTSYWTKVIDTKTLKSCYFSNETEALDWIDNRKSNNIKNKSIKNKIKSKERKIDKIKKQQDILDNKIWSINKEISDLKSLLTKELS